VKPEEASFGFAGRKPCVEFKRFFSNGDFFAFFLCGRQKESRSVRERNEKQECAVEREMKAGF